MKKHSRKGIGEILGWLLLVLVISLAVATVLGFLGKLTDGIQANNMDEFLAAIKGLSDGSKTVIVWIEAVVAAISVAIVAFPLRKAEQVEKEEFILQYNQSFIENDKMTDIESYLEFRLTGDGSKTIKDLAENRQDMVNYLVYLEGLASCGHKGVLDYKSIDDLFAYRFLVAMNHPEVQAMDLRPWATYYRGCFRLYEEWRQYRILSGKYDETSDPEKGMEPTWDITFFDTELCNYKDYEKCACPEITYRIAKDNSKVFFCVNGLRFLVVKIEGDRATIRFEVMRTCVITLKRLINEIKILFKRIFVAKKRSEDYIEKIKYVEMIKKNLKADGVLRAAVKYLVLERNITKIQYKNIDQKENTDQNETAGQNMTVRKNKLACKNKNKIYFNQRINELVNRIQKTQAMMYTYNNGVFAYSLFKQKFISDEHLEQIAELIYDTDKYIFPDMFGCKAYAKKVLKYLFRKDVDGMFNLDNLFVYRSKGEIVGVILWNKGPLRHKRILRETKSQKVLRNGSLKLKRNVQFKKARLKWSPDYIKKAFDAQGIRQPGRLNRVAQQYVNGYSNTPPNVISILNFCVSEKCRGQGVGKKMMRAFLEQHGEDQIELCVLTKNESAIKVYKSCGFTTDGGPVPAYPKKQNHERFNMKREKKPEENKK